MLGCFGNCRHLDEAAKPHMQLLNSSGQTLLQASHDGAAIIATTQECAVEKHTTHTDKC